VQIKVFLNKRLGDYGVIEIKVEDNGIGIKREDQKKLFKMFGFLDSTKEINTKGIGLGLHICKLITEQFGGSCSVQSAEGVGSVFSFTFHLSEPQLENGNNGLRRIQN